MSIAQHAERILAAWNVADPEKFQTELENALHCCQRTSNNIFETEQRELLESVVEQLRAGKTEADQGRKSSAQGLSAGFALLQAPEPPHSRLGSRVFLQPFNRFPDRQSKQRHPVATTSRN